MGFFGFLFVPLIIFLSVVAPLWVIFHYITKWKQMKQAGAGQGQTVVERTELRRIREVAGRLEERIEALETILDADGADWRNK
ncbi:MAG: envelope stress response membrane protein PspB [Alphaproteobacteria bacterium]|jgi:phage shock protein B|nr:envelope stress response membrane protein PspB [Alphaproteobacteria bacterium]MDP6563814.1 envelope stress response membrane protein PspB [Alphaproteobacteria bacterium]MDP6811749.1 envelope stress response membrane protein PspB [Alphaproteobacteria bacterium]